MTNATEIKLKNDTGEFSKMLDEAHLGTVTTEHPASSYGQPVVLMDGALVDYADIESLHLIDAPLETYEAARALESFGIRVTRIAAR